MNVLSDSQIAEIVTQIESEEESENETADIISDEDSDDDIPLANLINNVSDTTPPPVQNIAENIQNIEAQCEPSTFVFDLQSLQWKTCGHFKAKPVPFSELNVGYQSNLTKDSQEIDFFKEIISPDTVEKVAEETNSFCDFQVWDKIRAHAGAHACNLFIVVNNLVHIKLETLEDKFTSAPRITVLQLQTSKSVKGTHHGDLILTEDGDFVGETGVLGRVTECSAVNLWKNLNASELYLFFAVWFLQAVHGLNNMSEGWSTKSTLQVPIFSKLMSRNRFFAILRFLHFSSNVNQPAGDRMYKIRCVYDHVRHKFKTLFEPSQNTCIDESLLLFKGRLSFKQNIKTERARFGIKFYKFCESSSGYIVDFFMYLGAKTESNKDEYKIGKSGAVVMTLMQPYLDKGYYLFVDNFYTSPTLCKVLKLKGTNLCGTVRLNRKGMPSFPKLEKGEMQAKCTDDMMVVKYMDRREVHVLTSIDNFSMDVVSKKRKREEVMKPTCIVNYNKNMGAVDKTDMLLSSIESVRKTVKWYKKVFFHLLDLAILNAYVLYKSVTKKKISLHQFRLNLIDQLIAEHKVDNVSQKGGKKLTSLPIRLTEKHFPSQIPPTDKKKSPTRQCHVCSNTQLIAKKRKESRYECKDCKVTLCIEPCFQTYHSLARY
ncbi:piggyBac transposable element-derived protein 4-like [Bemisia tabaci]|uniref:piggyBac transposable element-derived protein 4-like n=1 Tax=Bemisia tabaci TaxID=7038 RepID=UPI003B27EC34